MIRAIRRVGTAAAVLASLFGMHQLQTRHRGAPATEVWQTSDRAVVALQDARAHQSVVPTTQAAILPLEAMDSTLWRDFPERLAEVVEASGFSRSPNGFTARGPAANEDLGAVEAAESALSACGGLRLELPLRGEGAAILSLPTGLAVEVRELGGQGRGREVRGAVVYGRPGGTSYWRTTDSGYEEWLLVADAGGGPVAQWEVRGGRLTQDGEAVLVSDAEGRGQLRVTAPKAYGSGGRIARAWLRAERNVIALYTTARGRALVDPLWTRALGPVTARANNTATLLQSGSVLVAGGYTQWNDRYHGIGSATLASSEIYEPTTGTWSRTGSLATARNSHSATLLQSGKVLVAGGTGPLASAELYDPATGTWSTTGSMLTARASHTAVLLLNGKVLVTGDSSAELYDPATEEWSATGARETTAPAARTATLLVNGKVLVTGDSSAELYDPATATWSPTDHPTIPRSGYTATLLASGKVLVAGGINGTGLLSSAEIYDPETGRWSWTGSLGTARQGHSAPRLSSGKVLVTGGVGSSNGRLTSAELYDPDGGTWSATESSSSWRFFQTATLLPSGKVLIAGSCCYHGWHANYSASAEVYDPAGLVISPLVVRLPPGGRQSFTATGGSGVGYTWSLFANDEGGTLSGTGVYTAGATEGLSDYVSVTDSVGNFAMAQALVTTELSISPGGGVVAPRATQSFTAAGGSGTGYTWELVINNSGGTVSGTGLYTAGPIGGVYDAVRVTDSLGNTVVPAYMLVGPALTISPATAIVAPGASQTFTGSGGSGTGFSWAFVTNASGGTLSAYGVYTAGPSVGSDVISATDSLGNYATAIANPTTTDNVVVSPAQVTLARLASHTFTATGGSGVYTWALFSNHSGGSVTAAGVYTAGVTGGVTDWVQATDSMGRSATALVTVLGALTISPSSVTVRTRASQVFSASGGTGAGYVWSLTMNSSGGSVTSAGVYTAGSTGGVTDEVRLTDSSGDAVTATVTVTSPGQALAVSPSRVSLAPTSNQLFTASGGSGTGYAWALATNGSGGVVTPAGLYTAGPAGGATDVVRVTDSLGAHADAIVTVTGGTSSGCDATGGGALPLLALVVLPLLMKRRGSRCAAKHVVGLKP